MTRSRNFLLADQADGLRRMFAASEIAIVPVVANPHVEHHGTVLARLAGVFAEQGLNTVVVDAADTAPEPGELAFIDLAACIEPLAPQLAYLAARGLPQQHIDTHGSCESFLPRAMGAVADVDVVVVHADARVLARMLGQRDVRPVLMAGADGEGLKHGYAALKMMVQRLGLASFDLALPTSRPRQPSPRQIAERLADCADRFLGAALHAWAAIDPHPARGGLCTPELLRLAAAQLGVAPASTVPAAAWPHGADAARAPRHAPSLTA